MKKSKEKSGVSLISLVITVVIMSILIGVSTYYGISSYKQAQVKQFVTEMQLIQTKVDELVELNEYQNLGSDASAYSDILTKARYVDYISGNINDFRYFSKNDLKNQFDIENINEDVLINFTTREVVSTVGIEYEGIIYYTQYKLPEGQELIQTASIGLQTMSFEYSVKIEGLNGTIAVKNCTPNSKLTYAYDSGGILDYKTVCNYTGKDETYYINVTKTGLYFVVIEDNTNEGNDYLQSITVTLVNNPKTNMEYNDYDYTDLTSTDNWARVSNYGTSGEDYYIWVPRFAVNNNTGDIKFVRGNTNIATDDTYLNSSEWTVPSIFTYDEAEYTGMWIYEDDISDIDDVINGSSFDSERMIKDSL